MATELWHVQDLKKNQRGITQKLIKGEQSFLCRTHCLNLLHIPIQLYEDIMKIVYGWTGPCHNTRGDQKVCGK